MGNFEIGRILNFNKRNPFKNQAPSKKKGRDDDLPILNSEDIDLLKNRSSSSETSQMDDEQVFMASENVDTLAKKRREGTKPRIYYSENIGLLSEEEEPIQDMSLEDISSGERPDTIIPQLDKNIDDIGQYRSQRNKIKEKVDNELRTTLKIRPVPNTNNNSAQSNEDSNDLGRTQKLSVSEINAALSIPSFDSSHDEYANSTIEGAPVSEETEISDLPPPPGQRLKAESGEIVLLEDSLGEQNACIFYRARLQGYPQAFTAVWSSSPYPEPNWEQLPDSRLVRPVAYVKTGLNSIRIFDRPKGSTVLDYLLNPTRSLPALATIELGLELAQILESLHSSNYYLYNLAPSQIVIERGGTVRLYAVQGFYRNEEFPNFSNTAFIAPEVTNHLKYCIGAHSDVYAVALLIYALARTAPLVPQTPAELLCSPRIFRPECPLGIWPYLQPCLEADPKKRIGHAFGLKKQFEKIKKRLLQELEAAENPPEVSLDAWAELHIGVGKSRRGGEQQDRVLSLSHASKKAGLFIIADGVSRSQFGSGAIAASQVEKASWQQWNKLLGRHKNAVFLDHNQRATLMKNICQAAGHQISSLVNTAHAPLPPSPNQVMSSTFCSAYIVNSEATFSNLGDSRAYLIRDEQIERISIDHDRASDALRMGLSFEKAANIRMGAALTRVVGRVSINSQGISQPAPFAPENFQVQLLPDDMIVLCSDGIPDYVCGPGAKQTIAEQKILEIILSDDDPAVLALKLIGTANIGGGYDNLSCVVVSVKTKHKRR